MTIDFTCQKCEASFEIDAQDLIDGSEKLACPHCNARTPANLVDDFVSALTELRTQVAALAKRFSLSVSIETEDLEDELESEDVDEADETDEDELDFDEEDEDEDEEDEDELEDEDDSDRA